MLQIKKYDRLNAVKYAQEFALKRNIDFFDYSAFGGNCTNFCSQCLFAGCKQMNFSRNGWFYLSPKNTSLSWANVEPFYQFLTTNEGSGPFAKLSSNIICEVGDIIQLKFKNKQNFSHCLFITKKDGVLERDIFVCANTNDSKNIPLSSYTYEKIRFLHILGFRKNV